MKNRPSLAGHGAEAVRDAIASTIGTLPDQLCQSLTWDQGSETAQHAQLRIDTGLAGSGLGRLVIVAATNDGPDR